jgi:ADP-ribosylglycohydrolase
MAVVTTVAGRSAGQMDRAAGVLLGAATGDAFGAPSEPPGYRGTQLSVCIARVAASGVDLRTEEALDAVAVSFLDWASGGVGDAGPLTQAVLSTARGSTGLRPAAALRSAAAELHERTGRTAGNESLVRTPVVALRYLDDLEAMAGAARAVSELTDPHPLAGDACVLWCAAVRRAVIDRTFGGLREGLALLPAGRRDLWVDWIGVAGAREPAMFAPNGLAVRALQAAWSAVVRAYMLIDGGLDGAAGQAHIDLALTSASRVGDDTDAVAAIAGALLGARWGAGVLISSGLAARVHGWPGLDAAGLVKLSLSASGT